MTATQPAKVPCPDSLHRIQNPKRSPRQNPRPVAAPIPNKKRCAAGATTVSPMVRQPQTTK